MQNGEAAAKTLAPARILLKADATRGQPDWTDQAISDALDVSVATIERVRRIYVQQGLAAALKRKSRTQHRSRRLDGNQEAHLIALACSAPPVTDAGRSVYWRSAWSNWSTSRNSRTRPSAVRSKKRTQTVAEETMVYPTESQWRICSPAGKRAGCLSKTV
jgi:hypothetical protein